MVTEIQRKASRKWRKKKYATDEKFRTEQLQINKVYRESHKETVVASNKAWRKNNIVRHRKTMCAYRKTWRVENPIKEMFYAAKIRAKKNELEFNLIETDIVMTTQCPVFNIPFKTFDRKWAPSLDRIDNTKGYIKGNIVVVSRYANEIKRNASAHDLKLVAEFYSNLNP